MREYDRHRANDFLASMPANELAQLAPHLDIVPLKPRAVLAEAGSRAKWAYFPHAGVICLMAVMRKGIAETATVGPEGFTGFEALLGGSQESQRVLVQVAGTASRIPIAELVSAAEKNPALKKRLLSYVRSFVVQALQSVACNSLHAVNQRCARWLLMAHDRARTDSFNLTHEYLAEMLGTHRPSVTLVARGLQQAELIRYSRGVVTITNRKGLERAACECYGIVHTARSATPARRESRRRKGASQRVEASP